MRLAEKIPHFLHQVGLGRIELPAGSKLQIFLRSLNVAACPLFIRRFLLRRKLRRDLRSFRLRFLRR